jgi:hypothetical protein
MVFVEIDEANERPLPYEPHLSFTEESWRQLVLYTLHCPFEIGGLGLIKAVDKDFLVTDVLLVKQDVNDIATRLDSRAVSELIMELIDSGQDPGELKLWWHSHAHEAPFWSGVDQETIENFKNDYMISLVANHQLQFLARQDTYTVRRTTWVWVDKPPWRIDFSPKEIESVRTEIAVKTRHVPRNTTRLF